MFSVQCHRYLRKHRNSEARVTLRNNRGQLPLLIRWCVLRSTYIFAAFTVCRSIQFGCTGFSLSLTGFLPCFIWLLTRFSSIGFFFVVYTSTTHLFFLTNEKFTQWDRLLRFDGMKTSVDEATEA